MIIPTYFYFCLKYGNLQILNQGAFSKKHLQKGDIGAKNEIDRDIIKHNIILLFHNLCLQGHLVFDSISQNNYIFFRFLFYVPR